MIPATMVGLLELENEIELLFSGEILLVGSMLVLRDFIVFVNKAKRTNQNVNFFTHSSLGSLKPLQYYLVFLAALQYHFCFAGDR